MNGKSNLIVVSGSSSGTSIHNDLTGRDAANQHPITAISNLGESLLLKQEVPTIISSFIINDSEWEPNGAYWEYRREVSNIPDLGNMRPIVYFSKEFVLSRAYNVFVESTDTNIIISVDDKPISPIVIESIYLAKGGIF